MNVMAIMILVVIDIEMLLKTSLNIYLMSSTKQQCCHQKHR